MERLCRARGKQSQSIICHLMLPRTDQSKPSCWAASATRFGGYFDFIPLWHLGRDKRLAYLTAFFIFVSVY